MHKIVWLASYPKSGNTWTRALISSLMRESETVDINALNTDGISSSRKWFDTSFLYKSSLLTHEEIDNLRPDLYIDTANKVKRLLYVKVHDSQHMNSKGDVIFPDDSTHGTVYIIRNPLDVCVSLSNHNSISIDESVQSLGFQYAHLANGVKRLNNQLRQKMGTWSNHVRSWTHDRETNPQLLVMRYEDMLYNSVETVTKLAKFANLPHDLKSIEDAVKNTAFETLKSQEQSGAFKEKPAFASSFFREGKSGSWHKHLTMTQARKIISDHREVMEDFGYLDSLGNPIY